MWIGLITIYTSILDSPYLRYYWEKQLNHISERSMIVLYLVHRMEDVRCVPNMFVRNWLAVVNVIHCNVRGLLSMIEESSILLYRGDPAGLLLPGWQALSVLWYQIDLSRLSNLLAISSPCPSITRPVSEAIGNLQSICKCNMFETLFCQICFKH